MSYFIMAILFQMALDEAKQNPRSTGPSIALQVLTNSLDPDSNVN